MYKPFSSPRRIAARLPVLAAACALAGAAQAHVTLKIPRAPVGADYTAVLQIGHGCQGSPTTQVSVLIPAGVVAVRPRPQEGWQIQATQARYDQAYDAHGSAVTEGVRTITWTGGSLPDGQHAGFAFDAYLAPTLKPGTTLYFPTVQTCAGSVIRWIEVPAANQAGHGAHDEAERPAPALHLLAPRDAQ